MLSQLQDDAQRRENAAAAENSALREQVMAVTAGRDVHAAVDAIRASDAREISAMSRQVDALQARLSSAKKEKARLHEGSSGAGAAPLTLTLTLALALALALTLTFHPNQARGRAAQRRCSRRQRASSRTGGACSAR